MLRNIVDSSCEYPIRPRLYLTKERQVWFPSQPVELNHSKRHSTAVRVSWHLLSYFSMFNTINRAHLTVIFNGTHVPSRHSVLPCVRGYWPSALESRSSERSRFVVLAAWRGSVLYNETRQYPPAVKMTDNGRPNGHGSSGHIIAGASQHVV